MANIPSRVASRLVSGIKKFQPILAAARTRDVGESDTVTIINDMLGDIFGYDKFLEVTSEFAIRGTYCDLAIKLDGEIACLIEAKPINSELKTPNIKQAVDYASNQGVEWVILTNGAVWKVYKVTFSKPINQELVTEFDICQIESKNEKCLEQLYLVCKEGWAKSALDDYSTQKQALSRFFLAAVLLSDKVVQVVRRELRRISPDVSIDAEEIINVLSSDVIKRDALEGDKAVEAKRKIARAAAKQLRDKNASKDENDDCDDEPAEAREGKSKAEVPDVVG